MKRLASLIVVSLTVPAMAGNPTTQRSFPLLVKPDGASPAISTFNPNDFNLNYRPLAPSQKLPNLTITPSAKESSDAQLWHSSQFNGQTVWNRPAIFDSTVHTVKDTTTGTYFYYRDFANTVNVPLFSPHQVQIGGGPGHAPYRGLDLLDDRQKQQK